MYCVGMESTQAKRKAVTAIRAMVRAAKDLVEAERALLRPATRHAAKSRRHDSGECERPDANRQGSAL